jgi:ABC-type multidrug transport system ATPase subunit
MVVRRVPFLVVLTGFRLFPFSTSVLLSLQPDVLAGYKTGGHIAGEININGLPKTKDAWQAIAGYCEQVDLHNPSLTVRESLVFAARMRLRPFSMADDAKLRFADSVLVLMELDEFADMLVGDEAAGQGLPKHVRKRLTLGVELAAKPSILFADEPTSGLDSVSASVVVSSLERAAKRRGLTVVCTIHQPSREVFETFDNLLLLRKGGVCVYNGSIDSIDDYIESVPGGDEYAMPSEANPADHVLDVLCGTRGRQQDWGEHYSHSTMASDTLSRHLSCSCDSCMTGAIQVDTSRQSFASELYLEVQRQLLVNWRTPAYMAVRFWWTVCACLIIGVIYFQASDSGLTNVIGAIFL